MKKSTFVRNGNISFTGLTQTEPERGRTLIICPFCHGDAVENSKNEFVCQKCGKKVDQKNIVKPVKEVLSQPWYTA